MKMLHSQSNCILCWSSCRNWSLAFVFFFCSSSCVHSLSWSSMMERRWWTPSGRSSPWTVARCSGREAQLSWPALPSLWLPLSQPWDCPIPTRAMHPMLHCSIHEHNKFCITPQLNPGLPHPHCMIAKMINHVIVQAWVTWCSILTTQMTKAFEECLTKGAVRVRPAVMHV